MNSIHYDTPLPIEMDRFWSSSNNKLKLQMLLHTQAIKHGIETPFTVHVVASCFSGASDGATCKGVMDDKSGEMPDLCPDVEEADALSSHMQCMQLEVEFNVLLPCLVTQMCLFSSCTIGVFSILKV